MISKTPFTSQEEAIALLSEVITDLTSSNRDLKLILRRCLHVCELLGWESQKDWFHQELNGYYSTSSLPLHRKITGIIKWEPGGSVHDTVKWQSEEMVYGVDSGVYKAEVDTLEVWTGIDWFLSSAHTGHKETLDERKEVQSPSSQSTFTLQRVREFSAASIIASLAVIESRVFDFASKAYVQLRYGNVMKEIWDGYRTQVEAGLSKLDLTKHLQAIEIGLQSVNPELWRSAVLECRNLLNDLANYLWRDPKPRYEHLPGKTEDGKLDVTQGKFGNRIAAYIHQKGISRTKGKFLRNEAERLATSIQSLISFQSEAHEQIDLQDARSVAVSTYILIGELFNRTDLEPIKEYTDPVVPVS